MGYNPRIVNNENFNYSAFNDISIKDNTDGSSKDLSLLVYFVSLSSKDGSVLYKIAGIILSIH